MACSSASDVVELAPEVFGLTTHANSQAQAARLGVEKARAHCAAMQRGFEVTRSHIGALDYTIAFRCPRPDSSAAMQPGLPMAGAMPPAWESPIREPQAPVARSGRGAAPAVGLY